MATVNEGTIVGERIIGVIPDTQDGSYVYVVLSGGQSFKVWATASIQSKQETENVLRAARRYLISASRCLSELLAFNEQDQQDAKEWAEYRAANESQTCALEVYQDKSFQKGE